MTSPVLVITGASRGIGAATAAIAAARGYAVCVNYREQQQAAERVVADITAKGGTAVAVQADISDEAQVVRLFVSCDAALGRVTALVNNAGILGMHARVDELDTARINRIFATNVTGAFLCAREAVKRSPVRTARRSSTRRNWKRFARRRSRTRLEDSSASAARSGC